MPLLYYVRLRHITVYRQPRSLSSERSALYFYLLMVHSSRDDNDVFVLAFVVLKSKVPH